MRARVVIGANFGDEGKGLMTDYLCAREGAGVVVRFNGGAQAGHTVVTPDGERHVFQHFGSGAFAGVPTFLSQFFVCNPLQFAKEADALGAMGLAPEVYAHPTCRVTTFADMVINQRREDARGIKRHGSVGLGVHETMQRSEVSGLRITMADLWSGTRGRLADRMREICGKWAAFRTGTPIADAEAMIEAFLHGCEKFAATVHPAGIGQCKEPVFEGAQGLLLSQDNAAMAPHLTHSYTGMRNVRLLCEQAGIKAVDVYYVSRTYLTRHGAGPLPGEDAALFYPDDTNKPHPYQGHLRYAPLDYAALRARCDKDAAGAAYKLVLTHCDQRAPDATWYADMLAYGPTRQDVEAVRR